jgi:hypothetical protein
MIAHVQDWLSSMKEHKFPTERRFDRTAIQDQFERLNSLKLNRTERQLRIQPMSII